MKLDSLTAPRPAPFLCVPASTVTLTHAKYDIYLNPTESLCCLKSSYKPNVQLWLCRCADALQRLFCAFPAAALLSPAWLPWVDGEPLCGRGAGCSVLPKHKLHRYRCVQRKRKQQMTGEGLVSCLVVGKWWGLAQAHLRHFFLFNDFRLCSCFGPREGRWVWPLGWLDGHQEVPFISFHVQFTILTRSLLITVFWAVGQSWCFISDRDEMNPPLLSHLPKSRVSVPSMLGTHSLASKATSSSMVSLTASSFCKWN